MLEYIIALLFQRHKTKQLLEDYVIPHMFQDDLFNYAAFTKRPPHRFNIVVVILIIYVLDGL